MQWIFLSLFFLVPSAFAVKAAVKLEEINTSKDTTIEIKNGTKKDACVEYEVVEGENEIPGHPAMVKSAAYENWVKACDSWKTSMREMNKDSKIITLNCNTALPLKDEDQTMYKSMGTYKIRIKIRDKE